jgi:hypothetical protein
LYTHPYLIISSFLKFIFEETRDFSSRRRLIPLFVVLLSFIIIISQGPLEQQLKWYGTWFVLGISSSIAVGAGFHTFILFLGPYIAQVALAAYECHSVELLIRNPDRWGHP